jgi:hypothetical protein
VLDLRGQLLRAAVGFATCSMPSYGRALRAAAPGWTVGPEVAKPLQHPVSPVRAVLLALAMCAPLVTPSPGIAQNNFEIQVYGSETVAPGSTMVELHSNVAAEGSTKTTDHLLRTQGAFHETLEVTQGWTSWFETGFYVFTSIQPDTTWEWVGDHIRPRVRAPEGWNLPVGLSLSAEIGYQRRAFSTDTWTLELRPIIDKQWKRWYVSINPVLDRAIQGESTGNGFEFSPAAKVSCEVAPKVALGLEYYGSLGPVTHFNRAHDQQHQLFPVIDLDLGPKWEFNFGVGFGLTPSTDRLIVKMILGYRFEWAGGEQK